MKKEYSDEKEKIACKLYDILDLKNNSFLLYELDEDLIKQEKIMNLFQDIEIYFKTIDLNCLHNKNKKRLYMSIIRSIFKYMKYEMIMQTVNIKTNKNEKGFIRTQKYIILKNNDI